MFLPFYDTNPRRHIVVQAVTVALIAANVGAFLLWQGMALDVADFRLALIPVTFQELAVRPPELLYVPEEVTLLSYAFLHAGWLHLAGNMLFLWVFGDNVEDAMGHVKFLLFYLACGAAGGLAYAYLTPDPSSPLVGASGATSGVVAAYLMLHPRVRVWVLATLVVKVPLPLPAFVVLGAYVAFNLIMVLGGDAGSTTAWWAHVGGLAAGAALTPLLKHRHVRLFDRNLGVPGGA